MSTNTFVKWLVSQIGLRSLEVLLDSSFHSLASLSWLSTTEASTLTWWRSYSLSPSQKRTTASTRASVKSRQRQGTRWRTRLNGAACTWPEWTSWSTAVAAAALERLNKTSLKSRRTSDSRKKSKSLTLCNSYVFWRCSCLVTSRGYSLGEMHSSSMASKTSAWNSQVLRTIMTKRKGSLRPGTR